MPSWITLSCDAEKGPPWDVWPMLEWRRGRRRRGVGLGAPPPTSPVCLYNNTFHTHKGAASSAAPHTPPHHRGDSQGLKTCSHRFAGTAKQYSANAMPQLAKMASTMGHALNLRCRYLQGMDGGSNCSHRFAETAKQHSVSLPPTGKQTAKQVQSDNTMPTMPCS